VTEDEHARLVARYGKTKPRSEGPTRKGRRTDGYALRGLAVCGRCGRPMDCHTRKDHGPERRRFYRCRSFAYHEPCGASVDAREVAAQVQTRLHRLTSDFDTWREAVLTAASEERAKAQRELDSALEEIDRLDARGGRIEQDYLAEIDRDDGTAGETLSRRSRD
jgi:outer membrane murein-binding lipoprotein Lpp